MTKLKGFNLKWLKLLGFNC